MNLIRLTRLEFMIAELQLRSGFFFHNRAEFVQENFRLGRQPVIYEVPAERQSIHVFG